MPEFSKGLANTTGTKCYANVIVVLLWKLKFAHQSMCTTQTEENHQLAQALMQTFQALDSQNSVADIGAITSVLHKYKIWEVSDREQDCANAFLAAVRHRLGAFEHHTAIEQLTTIAYNDVTVVQKTETLHGKPQITNDRANYNPDICLDVNGVNSVQHALDRYLSHKDTLFEPQPNFGEKVCVTYNICTC